MAICIECESEFDYHEDYYCPTCGGGAEFPVDDLWWDDASYIRYQSVDYGDWPPSQAEMKEYYERHRELPNMFPYNLVITDDIPF